MLSKLKFTAMLAAVNTMKENDAINRYSVSMSYLYKINLLGVYTHEVDTILISMKEIIMLPLTLSDLFVDGLFNDLTHDRELSSRDKLYKLDDMFYVSVDVPGVKREDVRVTLDSGRLTVECERKDHFKSRFRKSYTVGNQVDAAGIECTLVDGVLHIKLPVVEASKPRHIAVK